MTSGKRPAPSSIGVTRKPLDKRSLSRGCTYSASYEAVIRAGGLLEAELAQQVRDQLGDERETLQARNSQRAQRIEQLEAELASAQQSQPAPQPQQEQPSQAGAHYDNCSEARAAGAAPLRRGEPGYRDALDGDNDGVACE